MTKLLTGLLILAAASSTWALPTMVRLGYPNCVSCHVSPQGGGLLNEYGRGIDEAQSLRAGEYVGKVPESLSLLTLNGRLDQDVRVLITEGVSRLPGAQFAIAFRSRFYYRTSTNLAKPLRLTVTAAGENEPSPRRSFAYDPAIVPGQAFVPLALLQYRPKEGIELAVGRDQLPMGVYTGDLATLVRARNRFGYYDTPLQAKLFLWGKRWQAVPYVFAPSGRGGDQVREKGGGVLGEYDLFGKGRTIVGVNLLRGTDRLENRLMASVHTRLGFGQWGILAEHAFTRRELLSTNAQATFGQRTSYVQAFRAFREWLVGSLIFERVSVPVPFEERVLLARTELSARLSPNFTTAVRMGMQYDQRTGRAGPTATFILAWKTVALRPW
ncbi:MAG TPA: hypothetical protein VE621_08525 [Bryobacteraceae bacterium]|nr:hypothetical protein [Bryobacteraceae bacterium]